MAGGQNRFLDFFIDKNAPVWIIPGAILSEPKKLETLEKGHAETYWCYVAIATTASSGPEISGPEA